MLEMEPSCYLTGWSETATLARRLLKHQNVEEKSIFTILNTPTAEGNT